jgi:nucleoid-associated protein YgaU
MKKRKFTIDKKRFSKAVISFLVIMSLITVLCNFVFGDTISKEKDYVTVIVSSGDTLWEIASKYNTNGDVRKKIDDIIKFNKLNNSKLTLNQRIKVPIE